MSGPKTSSYELEQRRREEEERRLAEERRRREEEEKRRREAFRQENIGQIQKICAELEEYSKKINELLQYIPFLENYRNTSAEEQELKEMLAVIQKARAPYNDSSLESTEKKLKSAQSDLQDIKKRFDHFDGIMETWQQQVSQALDSETEGLLEIKHRNRKKNPVIAGTESPLNPLEGERNDQMEIEQAKAAELIQQLQEYEMIDNGAVASEIQRVLKVANNLYQLEDYHSVVSYLKENKSKLDKLRETIEKQREAEVAKQQELVNRFEDALLSYEVMCEIAGVEPQPMDREAISEEMISYLREERIRIEAEHLASQEKLIVQREMEAVMEELGYQVVATKETVRKSGAVIREHVFGYNEGTAIDIIEANGQITMEVVGIDHADREPSEEEKEYLEEEMESFCSLHKDIEDKLRARGVVMKARFQMNPPSKIYAQTININEYDHETDVKAINVRTKIKVPVVKKNAQNQNRLKGVPRA